MPWPPTTTELLDVVEGGVYHRQDSMRFELLDADLSVIGELHPRADREVVINNDTNRSVIRTMDGFELPYQVLDDINPITDRVRPWWVLQNGAEFPVGLFLWATDNRPLRSWGMERVSTLRDQSYLLAQSRGRLSSAAKGQNFLARAVDHAALRIPRDRIVVEGASGQAVAAPLVWGPEVPLMSIVNSLLAPIGYLPAHFNHAGELVFKPAPVDIDAADPDLIYRPGGRIIADSTVGSDDLLDAPNVYIVTETSGQGAPIIGRYQIPASAPHSVENRGYEVVKTIPMQGLTSTAQANAAAKREAQNDDSTFEWQQYDGVPDPRHDTYNVVQFLGRNYMEPAWRLQRRKHSHVLRRVY